MRLFIFGSSSDLSLKRPFTFLKISVLVFALMVPLLSSQYVSAATMTNRSATINKSAVSSTDVEFAFGYDLIDTAATKAGITYEFCTTPLGTCTLPTGMDVQTSNTHDSQSGWPSNATAFAAVSEASDTGDCTANTNSYMICYSRDETVATGVTGGAVTHTISGITAPSSVQTVYIRISIYSDNDFETADLLDDGTVAVAFVDQLTVNGRVQERLEFCVAAIDDDDSLPASVTACTSLTDSNVDLGVIDNSSVSVSPVEPTTTNGSDDDYGILMVNTNASGGIVVAYYPEDPTSVSGSDTHQLKSFRVVPADCDASASSETDQCFVSASNSSSGTTFSAGTEAFGVHVPCIDTSQGTTSNLGSVPDYYNNADDDTSNSSDCQNTGTGDTGQAFGWNASGTADTHASSSTIVDDEIIKLSIGATAAATTPTGSYTVVTTYIATPTF